MLQSRHHPGGAYLRPPIPPDEPQRLELLRSFEILDSPPEQAYDDIATVAAYICQTPMALVSFVDAHRQWFKSRVGVDQQQTSRDVAFCAHAIAMHGMLVIPDTLEDDRFAQNPLVLEEPRIRFYAGAPLRAAGRSGLGALCVIDRVPREVSQAQRAALEALARQVVAQLELRRQTAEVKRLAGMLPYCSSCGRLRIDVGDLCPACIRRGSGESAATGGHRRS